MPPDTAVATQEQSTALTLQDQIVAGMQAHKRDIRAFLPDEDAQLRFMRIVLRSLEGNARLQQATPQSIVRAAIEAAVYGLEPSGSIGGAHLVPFKNSETNELEAQLITDYRGDVHLARQSKEVVDAYAEVVRQADRFVDDRAQASVIHEPDLAKPRTNNPEDPANPIIAAYACIVFTTGFRRFVVMTKDEIEAIRQMAPGKNSPAWRIHWPEMAKKTVLKRALKTAPLPPMVRSLISREDTLDYTDSARVTVERPQRQALADRLEERRQLGSTEQPGQEPDGAPSGGHPAPADEPVASVAGDGEAAPARAAASPTETPTSESRSSDPATAQADEAAPPGTQPAPSTEQPEQEQGGSIPAPVVGAPAPVSPLDELQRDPSADTLLAFALDVLGIEQATTEESSDAVTLGTFTAAEWSQVIGEAVDSEDEWTELYRRLPAVAKAQLRARKQHPAGRAESKTLPNHPDAEQLRTAVDPEAQS